LKGVDPRMVELAALNSSRTYALEVFLFCPRLRAGWHNQCRAFRALVFFRRDSNLAGMTFLVRNRRTLAEQV